MKNKTDAKKEISFYKSKNITATKARSQLYGLIDWVSSAHHPICITGKRNNAILVSEDDWESIEETLYLTQIPGMTDSILQGIEESEEDCVEQLEDW